MIALLLNESGRLEREVREVVEFAHDHVLGRERINVAVRVKWRKGHGGGGEAWDRTKHGGRKWAGRIRFGVSLTVANDSYPHWGRPRASWYAKQMGEWYGIGSVERAYVECGLLYDEGKRRLGRWPIYYVDDWQEHLIHLAAHEFAHVLSYSRDRKRGGTSEVFCEEVAERVLNAWRLRSPLTNATALGIVDSDGNYEPEEVPMNTTTIKKLSANNVAAIREVIVPLYPTGTVETTATTATFAMPVGAALEAVRHAISTLAGRGHPKASLHAVARRIEALMAAKIDAIEPEPVASAGTGIKTASGPGRAHVARVQTPAADAATTTEEVTMSNTATEPAAPAAEPKSDIDEGLVDALTKQVKQLVKKPEFKTAPSGSYTAIKVDGKPIGYLHPQTRKGALVHLTISAAAAKRLGVKGAEAHDKGAVKAKVYVTKTDQVEKVAAALAAAVTETEAAAPAEPVK